MSKHIIITELLHIERKTAAKPFFDTFLYFIASAVFLISLTCPCIPANADFGEPVIVDKEDGIFIWSEPSNKSAIIGKLEYGDVVTVLGYEEGDWIRIRNGYINRDYLKEPFVEPNPPVSNEEFPILFPEEVLNDSETSAAPWDEFEDTEPFANSWDAEKGQAVADFAVQYEGLPFIWGSTRLDDGTDCSGFTYAVYNHFGIDFPRLIQDQSKCGMVVASLSEAMPGDLIFFENHVAIYLGDGEMIICNEDEGETVILPTDDLEEIMVRRVFC